MGLSYFEFRPVHCQLKGYQNKQVEYPPKKAQICAGTPCTKLVASFSTIINTSVLRANS